MNTYTMFNRISLGEYLTPTEIFSQGCELLVVQRVTSPGDYLLISDAGSLACNTAEVPEEPTIVNTLVGTLIRKDDETGRETFILNRTLPQGVSHPGAFFPADGCAEFTVTDHGPTLTVSGRHAHCIDPSDGQVKHQPEPIPAPEKGATWLFDAVQFAKPALATHEAVGEDA